ncbi:MAG TPA: carboxypeptidase-like regulatory domain-containing protein, partial [Puia sp.]
MRWTTLLLVMAFMGIRSAAYGQITLKEKNASLEKVLAAIEKQTQYVFLYDPDDLKMATVTMWVKDATVQATLEKCFKDLPIEFTIVGNNILLKKRAPGNAQHSADIRILGRVVDETGQPLPGVTVFNKRGKKGAETDTSGNYALSGATADVLRYSYVGYKDREITIGSKSSINVTLELNPSSPDQVVVIGYGSSKVKDLTGAISVVDMKNMDEIPFNTVDNALAGKAAGVQITKTDGTPGGMLRVRIRGASSLLAGNDPLYVIDGVPIQVRNNYIAPDFNLASP